MQWSLMSLSRILEVSNRKSFSRSFIGALGAERCDEARLSNPKSSPHVVDNQTPCLVFKQRIWNYKWRKIDKSSFLRRFSVSLVYCTIFNGKICSHCCWIDVNISVEGAGAFWKWDFPEEATTINRREVSFRSSAINFHAKWFRSGNFIAIAIKTCSSKTNCHCRVKHCKQAISLHHRN